MIPINCDCATGLWYQGSKTEISPCVENSEENWDCFQVTEACRMCEALERFSVEKLIVFVYSCASP